MLREPCTTTVWRLDSPALLILPWSLRMETSVVTRALSDKREDSWFV